MKWAKLSTESEQFLQHPENKKCIWLIDNPPKFVDASDEEKQEAELETLKPGSQKLHKKRRREKLKGRDSQKSEQRTAEFEVWAFHTFKHNPKQNPEHFKNRYEIFCGGWLEFYDREIRQGQTNHIIYLEWGKLNTSKSWVRLWISPPGKEYKEDTTYYGNEYRYIAPPLGKTQTDPPPPPPPPPPEM